MDVTPPQQNDEPSSLLERYERAVKQIQQGDYLTAVQALQELEEAVARQSLFSPDDESLDDIATSSIPLLQLEHDLALAYTQLPITAGEMASRQRHLQRAVDHWTSFCQKMQALEQLSADEEKQFQELLQLSEDYDDNNETTSSPLSSFRPPPLPDRETKIARFRLKQQAQQERQRLLGLKQRRMRLGLASTDELDGHDGEELDRTLALTQLRIAKSEALEEWASTVRELPMIVRMVREQQQQPTTGASSAPVDLRIPPNTAGEGGLQVTHISHDTTTGQLQFRREQIRSNVFRPGWNQPTMTLDELAEREVRAAEERATRQQEAETLARQQPRRYEQLLKDGLEDDADLVDASAKLDRQWDAFKDENPRGSGNKRGDEGDRNF